MFALPRISGLKRLARFLMPLPVLSLVLVAALTVGGRATSAAPADPSWPMYGFN